MRVLEHKAYIISVIESVKKVNNLKNKTKGFLCNLILLKRIHKIGVKKYPSGTASQGIGIDIKSL